MAELVLKSQQFRAEREADWRRLELLLAKAERGSAARLTRAELLELPVLYRSALSSLSVARSISLDQGLIDYLESLSTRAYFFVYGARSTLLERVGRFFARDWPLAVQGLWRETLVSALLLALGTLVAFVLVSRNPDWYYAFVPAELAQERDPMSSSEALRSTLYDSEDEGLSAFATFLFTHNARVALFAFALGFALCLPTAVLILVQGLMLGAFLALFASRGLGEELFGWLMIHGVTEFFAIILAGAAGFRIGWAVVFPGELSRMEAAAAAGRAGATVMAGVVVMLFVAGLLEGIGRQTITSDLVRYAIAATSLVLWLSYLYLPRRPQ